MLTKQWRGMVSDMQMADAHFHFDMKKEDPVAELIALFKEDGLSGLVLILNSKEEAELFLNNIDILKDCLNRIHIAVLFDINNRQFFEDTVEELEKRQLDYSVKLHSRISKTVREEFEKICHELEKYHFINIIVDAFFYGSNLENQIGVEQAIYLAKYFKNKKVIVAHFGGVKILETMLFTRDLPNIYYDISCTVSYFERTSIWQDAYHCLNVNGDRVMFGSDHPDFSVKYASESVQRLFERYGQNEELYKKLMYKNCRKIYFND